MTEMEVAEITSSNLEVVAALMGNYATHVGIYLSLAFGYCVAAYAAGEKLSRFQVIVASCMFVAATELQIILMATYVNASQELLLRTSEINPMLERPANSDWRQVWGITIWQLGILASLSFMWSVRRSEKD